MAGSPLNARIMRKCW